MKKSRKFFKIEHIFSLFRENIIAAYIPGYYLCIDETLRSFRVNCLIDNICQRNRQNMEFNFSIFVVSLRRIAYHILVNPGKMKKIQKKLEQKWLRICPKGFSMHLDV